MEQLPYNSKNTIIDMNSLCEILSKYGVHMKPKNINTYRTAMIHKSYCTRKNENILNGNDFCPSDCIPLQEVSNERLEFLGDSVLNLVVASYLYDRYETENEGFLTKMRTKLVNGGMLASLASIAELGKWVIISKQIEDNNGRENKKILEDCFEALIGAIYMDFNEQKTKTKCITEDMNGLGFQFAKTWIINFIEDNIDFCELLHNQNYKDMLFKYFQNNFKKLPILQEISSNPQEYTICVKDESGYTISVGKGETKKKAESEASKQALAHYGQL